MIWVACAWCLASLVSVAVAADAPPPGIYVRFKLLEPAMGRYYVTIAINTHHAPWGLGVVSFPRGAATYPFRRVAAGEYTPWFNLRDMERPDARIHERSMRSGGVAEFPQVTAEFTTIPPAPSRKVIIELATAADAGQIVKRFEESFAGSKTAFLVSPDLKKDAAELETAAQMAARHLAWAREASGGKAIAPKQLLIATVFSGVRPDTLATDTEAVHQLGINAVNTVLPRELIDKYNFLIMDGGWLGSRLDPASTPELCRQDAINLQKHLADKMGASASRFRMTSISDELQSPTCTPYGEAGPPAATLAAFRAWLSARKVTSEFLGVKELAEVKPIDQLPGSDLPRAVDDQYLRRLFYLSCRFRQESMNEKMAFCTKGAHEVLGPGAVVHAMTADHPFFRGSGMGYFGGGTLACDWFDLARRPAVDSAGIEDWLGLEYMYGPNFTWEGFQLLGYQASIYRSGARSAGRSEMPMMVWITPSDEKNVRLKFSSCLAQGVKNVFFWAYGPTNMQTENYWSDLRSEYDGVAAISRLLANGEDLLVPGRLRPTRLAVLFSISSDIWQPYGYASQLERRLTYFSLIHDQYPVDFLSEEDVAAGRLARYSALYVTEPCISAAATAAIEKWVGSGGLLYGACAAGCRNEYNDPVEGLGKVFGVVPVKVEKLDGNYGRGGLNATKEVDRVTLPPAGGSFGVLGVKVSFTPAPGTMVIGRYGDGSPAVVEHAYGKGKTVYFGTCPGISYEKDARYVPEGLKEKWPPLQRSIINGLARRAKIIRPVELSAPVVETGLYDSPAGMALVLANFAYEPIPTLKVLVRNARGVKSVFSVEANKSLPYQLEPDGTLRFTVPLKWNDLVLLRR